MVHLLNHAQSDTPLIGLQARITLEHDALLSRFCQQAVRRTMRPVRHRPQGMQRTQWEFEQLLVFVGTDFFEPTSKFSPGRWLT